MLTVKVGHGQRPGSGAARVASAARARVPSAPPTNTAASSRPSKLNMSQSIAVHLSVRRTTRRSEEQNRGHGCESTCRPAGATRRPHRCGPGGDGLLHRRARPGQRRSAGGVRHVRAPRVQPRRRVQRGAHPGHHAGDRRVPGGAGHHRTAVHRPRHPRAVGAGVGVGAGGAGRQRRCRDDRFGRPLHPDAGGQPRDPDVQPRTATAIWPTASSSRRRTTRRATAASSTTRPTADPPTPTPPA